jgi:aspartyl-tRNA(Asn)/glutamyl-tRNA(Gln) amidotransferase subunit B
MNYEPIIGLEIHVQTKTKSKMFCGCSTDYFGSDPNTHTCPTCLGLPGALPVPNRHAIDLCVKIALALNCGIRTESKFDRKNYFYPDLPKGYQITQYDKPFGENGFVEYDVNGETKKVRITRVHQEEDTGKSLHNGTETLLDYNKSGVPLVEIVTEPDFRSGEEVSAFARRLRQILRYLDASDADMEKGQMRIEPNISVRTPGKKGLPDYKVEVKNIASISVLDKVVNLEVARQTASITKGNTPIQETRGLVDMSGKTVSQRTKETEMDYRYFPEPDIPPITFEEGVIEEVRKSLPELPQEKKHRYISSLGMEPDIAETIVQDHSTARFFEEAIRDIKDTAIIAETSKWMVGEFAMLEKEHPDHKCTPAHLAELATLVHEKKITRTTAKEVLEICFSEGMPPGTVIKQKGLEKVSDESELEGLVDKVLEANPQAIEDVKQNPNAVMFLVGQVMKESKGQADAQVLKKLLEEKIG